MQPTLWKSYSALALHYDDISFKSNQSHNFLLHHLKGNCFWLYLIDLSVYTTVFKFESHWIKFQGDISTRSWPSRPHIVFGRGFPVMSQGELLQWNNTFCMGRGWFKTQGMKGETGFSAWKWSVLVKTTRFL